MKAVIVKFSGPIGPREGVSVEVEGIHCDSVEWVRRDDGNWTLQIIETPAPEPQP